MAQSKPDKRHLTNYPLSSECLLLVSRWHIGDRLLEQGKRTLHVSAELEEFITSSWELNLSDVVGSARLLLTWLLLLDSHGVDLGELLDIYVHAHVDIEWLASSLCWGFNTGRACSENIADWVVHVDDLADPQRVQLQMSRHAFLLLREDFNQSVCVLNGDTHLQQVLGEDLVWDGESHGLRHQELDQGQDNLGLFLFKVLITAQLVQAFLVVRLARQLLDHLAQDQLQLDCTHSVQDGDFGEDPLGAVEISAKGELHLTLMLMVLAI